jgi:S1-C subfamily serine protease
MALPSELPVPFALDDEDAPALPGRLPAALALLVHVLLLGAWGAAVPEGVSLPWALHVAQAGLGLQLGLHLLSRPPPSLTPARLALVWAGLGWAAALFGLLPVWGGIDLLLGAALLAWLWGTPGRLRQACAAALGLGWLAGAVCWVQGPYTGRPVLLGLHLRLTGQVPEEAERGPYTGEVLPYVLTLAPGVWRRYHPSEPGSWDATFLDPSSEAELRVRAQVLPGAAHADLDQLQERALRAFREPAVISREEPLDRWDTARLVRVDERGKGRHRQGWVGLYTEGDLVFEVVALAPAAAFARVEPGLHAAVASFAFTPQGRPQLALEPLRRVKQATALVRTATSQGSGVLVGRRDRIGYVVTNAHVLWSDDASEEVDLAGVRLAFPAAGDRALRPATVLGISRSADVAVLTVALEPSDPQPLPVREPGSVPVGTPVFTVGFPVDAMPAGSVGASPAVGAGRVIAPRHASGARPSLWLDVGIHAGNSGGPVVAADGSVLGLAQAVVIGAEISLGVPSDQLHAVLGLPLTWTDAPLSASLGAPAEAPDLEAALVEVHGGPWTAPGVWVQGPAGPGVLAPASVAESEGLTVVQDGTPYPAKLERVDERAGLAWLSTAAPVRVALPVGRVAPLPETTGLRVGTLRIRQAPWLPRRPVTARWIGAVLTSKPVGEPRDVGIDIGLHPELSAGPALDAQGQLVGFVMEGEQIENYTRMRSGEAIWAFLGPRLAEGLVRVAADGLGDCVVRVDAALDDPSHLLTSVSVRLVPAPADFPGEVALVDGRAELASRHCPEHAHVELTLVTAAGRAAVVSEPLALDLPGLRRAAMARTPALAAAPPWSPPAGWSRACDPLSPGDCVRACAAAPGPACLVAGELAHQPALVRAACDARVGQACHALATAARPEQRDALEGQACSLGDGRGCRALAAQASKAEACALYAQGCEAGDADSCKQRCP